MTLNWKFLLIFLSILLLLDFSIIIWTLLVKRNSRKVFRNNDKYRKLIADLVALETSFLKELKPREHVNFLIALQRWTKSCELPSAAYMELNAFLDEWGIEESVEKKLSSHNIRTRSEGLLLIELLSHDKQLFLLEKALNREKSQLLQLKMIEILCTLNLQHSVDLIIGIMTGAPEHFRKRIINFLTPYSHQLIQWARANLESEDLTVRRVLIIASSNVKEDWLLSYLLREIGSDQEELRSAAGEILFMRYTYALDFSELFKSPYPDVRKKAVENYVLHEKERELEDFLPLLRNDNLRVYAIGALMDRISGSPRQITSAFRLFRNAQDIEEKTAWADILSSRISYFAARLLNEYSGKTEELISLIVALGHYSKIINFINSNRDQKLEEKLREILMPNIEINSGFQRQCRLYLDEEILERWNIPESEKIISEPKFMLKKRDKVYMFIMMIAVLSLPILSFFFFNRNILPFYTAEESIVSFIFHYHYIFAYYNVLVNAVYFLLMFLSWIVINRQHIQWELTDRKFLFTPGLLPSVSILAPAFNEEKTIVQNVYSLLSINYSDFEVIVIDDGSSDNTTDTLIEQFHLELVDWSIEGDIPTAPIRGIYRSRQYPGLRLVKKQNGGKADALNAGINFSGGEYICSIDADSLLEPDALQKIMVRTLVHKKETVAVGGNVLPSNGSIVSNGALREIHLPQNRYARFQTVEYLRSFISNRLGWSRLNSLLVISGAFGIFKRDRLLELGGYMTAKGKIRQDTVGEDMEIVVHLYEHMKETESDFNIDYAYNANCWTEVPETLTSLIKQRDRWHRGLVEVMMYHKKMLFNHRYGTVGLLAFPYFLIFEMLGPFLESVGYLFLVIPFFFGLLDGKIIVFMFSIAVVLGILISSLSIFLAEKGVLYFKGRDFRTIVATSLIENFGWRQFMSMLRPVSYFMYIIRKRNKGWEKFQRKGFREKDEVGA